MFRSPLLSFLAPSAPAYVCGFPENLNRSIEHDQEQSLEVFHIVLAIGRTFTPQLYRGHVL